MGKSSNSLSKLRSFMVLLTVGLVGVVSYPLPAAANVPVGVEISFIGSARDRCLDADTHTAGGNGTKVQLWTCNNFAQQRWVATRNAQGYLQIKSQLNGRCLDADTHTLDRASTIVQLWECNGQFQQQWADDEQGDEQRYIIASRIRPTKVLDADVHTEDQDGTIIQLWEFNGQVQQQFWQGRY
jgi:hypothetical protein